MMKRNKFSLGYQKLFSGNMGNLYPIGLTQVLPGDSIQHNTTCLVRFSPLLAPVMHPTHVQLAHWFVPHRLVWDDFEDFITGGPTGTDASVYPTVTFDNNDFVVGSLADHLGIPPLTAGTASALPFRGYALIWNEWYRDQDLQAELVIDTTSGPDTTTSTSLQFGSWEKDYFTSARPWEQKGPQITIPIGTQAPVTGIGAADGSPAGAGGSYWETGKTSATAWPATTSGATFRARMVTSGANPSAANTPQIFADLTGVSSVTVNLLREALALQRFEEARARYGSRYVEFLRYLGVRSSDARLQRPEFLGGGRYPVQFSEVLQTAEGTDPVGELRGHGIGVARSNRYRRFFEEHGYIFTFAIVKPKAVYMSGLQRHWNYRTKTDFWQKELQHIGQQEILNKEVRLAHTSPDGTFGYQDRYDELRGAESMIAGEFRTTLNFWHFGRDFTTDPALNATFVKCVPTEEPFAVPSADTLYMTARHSMQARRLVARTGTSFIY